MKKIIFFFFATSLFISQVYLQAQITAYPGDALHFDGTDDYVSGTGFSTSITAITIEAWIYHDLLPVDEVQRYVTISPEVAVLRYDGSSYGGPDELHFYIKGSNGDLYSLRVDNVLTTSTWIHVTGTYDGTDMKLYLNGNMIASTTPANGLYEPDGNFSFSSSSTPFYGKIDEVRIWNTARSQQQIREDMHLTLEGTETDLINYWQFNEGSGTTVSDAVGGCTGTMYNMTQGSWVPSTIPAGSGVSNTQTETTGSVTFTGTGFSADYSSQNGASVTVSKLELAPNSNPNTFDDFFDNQYWEVNRFGTGSFMADFTFTVSEGFTTSDETYPQQMRLYRRGSNSDSSWTEVCGAASASSATGEAVFMNVADTGQFIISRATSAGTGLSFDGSQVKVDIPHHSSLNLGNILTFEAWIKPNDLSTRQAIYSNRYSDAAGSWQIEVGPGSGGANCIAITGPGTWIAQTQNNVLSTGRWYHIAYKRWGSNPGQQAIYIDGVSLTFVHELTYNFVNNTDTKTIGCGTSGTQFFNGSLDEIRLWSASRTQEEIDHDMRFPLSGSESNLVFYYDLNEGSGGVVHDLTGTNTGTIANPASAGWPESDAMVLPTMDEVKFDSDSTHIIINWSAPSFGQWDNYVLYAATDERFANMLSDYPKTIDAAITSDTIDYSASFFPYHFYFGASVVGSPASGNEPFSNVVSIVTPVIPTSVAGSGTLADPYQIGSLGDLYWISQTDSIWNDNLYFAQTADIDASDTKYGDGGNGFSPIGNNTTGFRGHYNGKGHIISGLYINRPSTDYVGLFGYTSQATIDSLGLKNISFTGHFYTGGLSGRAVNTIISNCYSMGNLDGNNSTGGLAGAAAANLTISNCYTTCNIKGEVSVGGLLGRISENSVIMVNNSFCTGKVQASSMGAGLFGEITGTLTAENCYSSCSVNVSYFYAGGLAGYIQSETNFSNCYNTGKIVSSQYSGGLFGHNSKGTVSNFYSTGQVEGLTSGGLIGSSLFSGTLTLTGCYWDTEASGKTNAFGVYYGSQTATGLTTPAMKQQASFENWDFDTAWAIRADSTYPALRAVDNAPFDLRNTIKKWNAIPFDSLLINDFDYETIQNNLILKVINAGGCTVSDDVIYFPENFASLDTCIFIYRTGETRPVQGDTIYGNEVTATLIRGAQEGIEGSGTEADPFRIKNLADLEWLSSIYGILCMDKYFIQTADIDADSTRFRNISGTDTLGFLPIGTDNLKFSGHYNGSGHTISGLFINRPDSLYIGLFGYTSGATIDSLGLTDCEITGKAYTGSLAGYAKSSVINNCYSTGLVNSTGGIIGLYLNSYSGGLIGYCYHYTSVNNSYSACNIFASGDFIGGLVGYNDSFSTISNSHSLGNLSGKSRIGGLAGKNNDNSTISKCYFAGSISAPTNSEGYIGGLVGMNQTASPVRNCYNTGSVNGSGASIGGLVGYNGSAIINSYSAGPVNATGSNIGGLVGTSGLGSVTNSFWDTETSGITTGSYGTGLTTAEMKQQSTFTDAGWDFMGETANGTDEIWAMIPQINSGYPNLFQQDDVLYTYNVTEIIGTTATVNARMRLTSALNVMSYGACWAQTDPPSLDDYKTDLGATSMNGNYSYSATLSGLDMRESYYALAYIITTENDTLFGNVIPFTTGGNGTANNPYQIGSIDDLEWLSLIR